MTADGLEVRLVGRFAVRRAGETVAPGDVGTRKARTLLAVLASSAPEVLPADVLADALWPGGAPAEPADNLATLVSRLRGSLGADVVVGDRNGWALGPGVRVDLAEAAQLAAQASADLARGEPAVAVAAASAALTHLERGQVLAGEPDAPWLRPVLTRAARLRRSARHLAAEAALAVGDPATAAAVADRAVEEDPYDETAVRLAMAAARDAGEPARALAAYERLRSTLADELGADPAPETRALHLELLTEQQAAPNPSALTADGPPPDVLTPDNRGLVGRAREWEVLSGLWSDAVAGLPALVLVAGQPGMGKTRLAAELAELARSTGGTVLSARCYETERSLFVQPFVDAVRPELLGSSPAVLRQLAGDRAASLALLVPEVADLLGPRSADVRSPEAERRLAYEAVTVLLRRLADGAPVLLLLDDLHNAGLATVELLHLLALRAGPVRLLLAATVRTDEGADALQRLADVSVRLDVGPLGVDAVERLAEAAGYPELAGGIAARTAGHPLFVVETLRALSAGEEGVPASLTSAVLRRVERLGPDHAQLVRAAAVLGPSFEPHTLAGLLDLPAARVAQGCERLVDAGLALVAGRSYEFVNDLVQEVLYAATPEPTRYAYHRLAADLLADRPEAAAQHAAACGEWRVAGEAWLSAGRAASARFAVADAESLLGEAVAAARLSHDGELLVQALLERGRAREALAHYVDSVGDATEALGLAQDLGLQRLEMLLHREPGGDASVAMGRPLASSTPHLVTGLGIAERLGDGGVEADLLARLAVLSCNRLDFVEGRRLGLRAAEAGRAAGDPWALRRGLDGLKTTYAYVGQVGPLGEVVAELEPLARRAGDLFLLQWVVFEQSFVPLAAGDWAAATARIEEALALCRRSGRLKYEGWYLAHLGWVSRLAGGLGDAVGQGRRAVEASGGDAHSWFGATAGSLLACSLLARDGDAARPEVVRLLRAGLATADRSGAEAYRLRCLAPLAWATGRPELLEQADRLLAAARFPPGEAWLTGMDAYAALARAWLDAGRPDRAAEVLGPLIEGADAAGWGAVLDSAGVRGLLATPGQTSSASRAATRSAPSPATGT